jgi:hypothetical protein
LPRCKAVLLCESVIRDEFTHKTTIVGILDTFPVPRFPGCTAPSALYLRVVGIAGTHPVSMEVRDAETGSVLFQSTGTVEFGNQPQTMPLELRLPIAPLQAERQGAFEIIVLVDQQEFERVHFDIKPAPSGQES